MYTELFLNERFLIQFMVKLVRERQSASCFIKQDGVSSGVNHPASPWDPNYNAAMLCFGNNGYYND